MSRSYQDAASRWAGIGPYYAMFPVQFADEVIRQYTNPGNVVLDPFAGRGTAVFSAAASRRCAIGIEINPVGYVYAKAKLRPASREDVEARLEELGELAVHFVREARELPLFFHRCFSVRVQEFLLAARSHLDWRRSKVDRTVMALLLVYQHGKLGSALSNQLRQTKSMSPQYAVRWWDERGLDPPDVDPVGFLKRRLDWRYGRGVVNSSGGRMYLGDSVQQLSRLRRRMVAGHIGRVHLLLTSPPYQGVTNYHYDQWLRLWLLGGPPNASRNGNGRGGKFEARKRYRSLLWQVFRRSASLLEKDATVYVRTDSREFTYRTTRSVLREIFPRKRLTEIHRPMLGRSQTHLFKKADASVSTNGEVDLVLES